MDAMTIVTQARIVPLATETNLLDVAKARAFDPAIFDTYTPFIWRSEISSNRLDAYYTVMDADTTLANYATDANTGVAVLIGHDSRALPVGASLTGALIRESDVVRVVSDAYALIEPTTEHIINRIKAGIARDVSVGFGGKDAQCLCSICGRDMYRDWDCPHIPGFEYEVTAESGRAIGSKTMVLCTGRIVNARLSEYSLVYDGATPGAAVLQAQRQAETGRITPHQAQLIEQRYRVRLPERRLTIQTPELSHPQDDDMPEENTTEQLTQERAALNTIRSIAEQAGAPSDLLLPEQVRWLQSERERLLPLAADGKAYRDDLIKETLGEQVRAFGADSEETYRTILTTAPIAVIKRMRDDAKRIGDQRFVGGRTTKDDNEDGDTPEGEQPAAPTSQDEPETHAYFYSS